MPRSPSRPRPHPSSPMPIPLTPPAAGSWMLRPRKPLKCHSRYLSSSPARAAPQTTLRWRTGRWWVRALYHIATKLIPMGQMSSSYQQQSSRLASNWNTWLKSWFSSCSSFRSSSVELTGLLYNMFWMRWFLCFQGDYGQSHRFCASDAHPLDFYSYGRTILMYFKSDTFMTGNGLSFSYQTASRYRQ